MASPAPSRSRALSAAVFLVAIAAAAARAHLALGRPLWFDELFTLWASRPPLSRLWQILASDSGPPLFYVLEIPFVLAAERIFANDAIARALPWAAALALFAAARWLPATAARRRFAMLLALSPVLTAYSAEARAYSVLAALVLFLFVIALVLPERPRNTLLASFLSAAVLYAHYLGLFAVAAVALLAASEKRLRSAVAVAAGAVPFLLWLPVMTTQPGEAVSWMHESPRAFVGGVLSSLGGAGRIPAPFQAPLPGVLVVAGGVVGLVLIAAIARSWRSDRGARTGLAFVLLVTGSVIFASLLRPVGFAGRTEMAILPVWLWTVAGAGERSRVARLATASALGVGALATAVLLAAPKVRPFPLAVLARVEETARPDDVLFAGAHFYLPARLSADRGRLTSRVRALPADQAAHPGWTLPAAPRPDDLAAIRHELDRTPPNGRVFFQVPPYAAAAIEPLLAGRGTIRRLAADPEMVLLVWRPG